MPVQIKGVGSISGLDQGIVVGIVTSSTQINVGSNIKFGSAGIATASNFKTGSSNLHSTGLTVGNNFLHTTGINVGTGATIHVPASNTLTFGTNSNERIRITSAGLVGVGQASPTHMLHVDSSNASDSTATAFFKGRIIRFDGAASTHSPRLNFSLDGTDKAQILLHRTNIGLDIATLAVEPIKFKINSLEKVRIDTNGRMGIGTDSPTYKLQIQDTGAYLRLLNGHESDYDLRFMTQNSEANIWHYGTDDFVIGTRYDRKFHLQQNAGKRLTIMGNGRIGINSTTPVRTMDIRPQAGATNSDLALTANSDSGFSQLIFAKPSDTYRGGVFYDFSEDQLKIHAGSQQIDMEEFGGPQGYMGVGNDIGNSSNDGSWDARFNVYGANHAKMEIHQNADDVRSHWWCHSGHAQAYIGTRSNHDFIFQTNNQNRAKFTNGGAFKLFDGSHNYIESADYRIYSNTSISDGYTGAIRTVARYNSNTGLLSHSETGGTGGASRWTFTKNCYCLLTVSQDVIGNTDTNYWWMGPKKNGSFIGQHLIRKTSHWDMLTFQQSFSMSANDWLEIAWGTTSGLTSVDGTGWSHYCFLIWENK